MRAASITDYIPFGKENAVTRAHLRAATGLPDRKIREEIEQARRKGAIIINAQDGAGYYQSEGIRDIAKQYRQNERRAYLREHGLTLCADGLRRLIIPKNGGNEEMKYKVCDHCGAHLDNGETCDCRNTNNDGGEPKDKQKERKNDNDGN